MVAMKNIHKSGKTLLVAFAFASCLAQADPVIDSVAGEVGHGNTLTIMGNSFGQKPNAAPRYWADFEAGIQPRDLGQAATWDDLRGELSAAKNRVRSTSALRSDVSSTSGSHGPIIRRMNSDKWYIFLKRYYDFDIATNQGPIGFNLKTIRFWPEKMGGSLPYGNNIYINYQGREQLGNGRAYNEYTTIDGPEWFRNVAPYRWGKWQSEEVIYESGGIDTQDGTFDWIRDGILVWNDRKWRMRTNERPNNYQQIFLDQVSNGTGPGPLWIYYDDIYMDDTWARVMLCDNANWTHCRQKEIQIPSAWSDGRIEFVLNLGDFDTASQSLFLYVVTAEGTVNHRGMLVSQCNHCPAPPTGVKIN